MPERRPRVLLTVSGSIPPTLDAEVAAGARPRADHRSIASRLGADVVDVSTALAQLGRVGRLLHRVGGAGPLLAYFAYRRRRSYDVVLSDGEQVGLPLQLLFRLARSSPAHVMIVHVLSVPKKDRLIRLAGLAHRIDRYVVYCEAQRAHVVDSLGVDPDRVVLMPFMVDTDFFVPTGPADDTPPRICSAGLERRDYVTLMDAVDGLDVDTVIAAASPWSRRADTSRDRPIPSNVRVERFDLAALRSLYASSRFVVVPLVDVDFQAGITTVLEAMAMGRPVVVTRTAGQTDTIVDGLTGRYVPPGDADALRQVIVELLGDRATCDRMGQAARAWAVEHAELDRYVDALALVVSEVSDASPSAISSSS
jgi:glycosyltransferase involved in cell wall biosynthesis